MNNLPSFSDSRKRQAYKSLLNQVNELISENPVFWNWKLSSYVTEPTLRKIFAVNDHLLYTKNISGAIIEFGCHDGTKQRLISHLLHLNKIEKAVIGFDSFQGYAPGVINSDYKFADSLFVLDSGFVKNKHKKFLEVTSELYGGGELM